MTVQDLRLSFASPVLEAVDSQFLCVHLWTIGSSSQIPILLCTWIMCKLHPGRCLGVTGVFVMLDIISFLCTHMNVALNYVYLITILKLFMFFYRAVNCHVGVNNTGLTQ